MEEFDERTEAAAKIKTLGEVPALFEDLVLADPVEVEPGTLDDAGRAQALARLEADRVPITPEQIDAAAQKYYRERVRRALLGAVAGPVGIVLAIWAISSIASGGFIFFWPIFVIIPTLLGGLGHIARKGEIIRNRKKELTRRARAQLGDAEAKNDSSKRVSLPSGIMKRTSARACSRRIRRTLLDRSHSGKSETGAGRIAAITATIPGTEITFAIRHGVGLFRPGNSVSYSDRAGPEPSQAGNVRNCLRLGRSGSVRTPEPCAW